MDRSTNCWMFALVLILVGCGSIDQNSSTQPSASSPDSKHADVATGGKADAPWSKCQAQHAVLLLNDPGTTAESLSNRGVHTRGANNLIDHRNGPDGAYPSEDDRPFATLEEIDEVYWVGPVALEQLTRSVSAECTDPPTPSADAIFSPQPYDESHLVRTARMIDRAEESIDIAMYSFGDEQIFEALERAADRGVRIRMIFDDTRESRDEGDDTMSARLERAGVDVRWVNKVMHHKFLIVDGVDENLMEADEASIATGSGNWSYGAGTRYDENTVFLQGYPEAALRLQSEFNHLWRWSRPYTENEDLEYVETVPVRKSMIPDWDALDVHFTSENFRTYHSSRYGNTFGILRGKSNVSSEIVRLIEEADESILVASGHLRSRPIAEALLEKHRNHPEMEIRIYLDGQEHISEGYHDYQVRELNECLDEATTEIQRKDCLASGFYFGYEVQDAGIPVRFKYYAYRWHYTYAEQMHHKYLIFDGSTLVTGSYNLSDNAEHNTMENIVVYESSHFADLVDAFESNFETIWKTGRAQNRYSDLLTTIRNASRQIPIVFDSMALTHEQIEQLDETIEQTCPAVYSDEYDDNPEEHTTCELPEN